MAKLHQNINELENEGLRRLLWKYFLPAFAGVVINSLYNVVDRIFIGQGVGALALSGLSTVFPIMLIMMGFGMLVGIGASVRVSINLGQKNIGRAEKVLGNALVLNIIIALMITVFGFLVKGPMLKLFGAGAETVGYANEYLNIILFGTIFNIVGFSLNNIIRSEGNARVAMFSMFISAGLNLILDPVFIFGLDMGVKGAAIATIISQFVLAIWVINHFLKKRSVIKLRLANFKLDPKIAWYIFTVGFAPFSLQVSSSFVQGTFNTQLISYGGDIAPGALGIINSVAMLSTMTVIAITMAAQPIIGFNYGAKNYRRVKKIMFMGIIGGTVVSLGGFLLCQIFPAALVKLFNSSSAELLTMTVHGMRIFMAAYIVVGFQIVATNYFQATSKAGIAAFLSLTRQVLILIPLLIILPNYFGLDGVWLAAPVADVTAALICSVFLIREIKRLNRSILLQEA